MTDPDRPARPTPEQIAALPAFESLPLERITLVESAAQADAALEAIWRVRAVGFDTESKPTFTRDAVRDGPHVIQLALSDRAFVVQVNADAPHGFLRAVLESTSIAKVGFGLNSDRGPLKHKLGIGLHPVVELSQLLRGLGHRQALGAKAAVAVVLGRRLHKSKSITTSNWALPRLSAAQLLYAANDAYAALKVFEAMGSPWPAAGGADARITGGAGTPAPAGKGDDERAGTAAPERPSSRRAQRARLLG
jgi:hypothetical protein